MGVIQMDVVYDAVFKKEGEKLFRKYYHILTKDHDEHHYNKWLNFVVDKYAQYRHYKNTTHDSQAWAIADGIEELVNGFNNQRFSRKDK